VIPQLEKLLDKINERIVDNDAKMIAGTCGGGNSIDGQMVNYRVAVIMRRELLRLREEARKIIGEEDLEDEAPVETEPETEV
jgi:hypothetical protein